MNADSEIILEVFGLSSKYDDLIALEDVLLKIYKGEIVSVVGANGAGKTTLLRTIVGLHRNFLGTILFKGIPIHHLPPYEVVRHGLVLIPEGRMIFQSLSVLENLMMGSYHKKARDTQSKRLETTFKLFPRLRERLSQRAGTLSGGEQQMLAIGRGLMSRPDLLILDEPSLGLAPLIVKEIFHSIREINQQGCTVLLVEQNVHQSLLISNRGYCIENGRIVLEGTGQQLLTDEHVKVAYMGL